MYITTKPDEIYHHADVHGGGITGQSGGSDCHNRTEPSCVGSGPQGEPTSPKPSRRERVAPAQVFRRFRCILEYVWNGKPNQPYRADDRIQMIYTDIEKPKGHTVKFGKYKWQIVVAVPQSETRIHLGDHVVIAP